MHGEQSNKFTERRIHMDDGITSILTILVSILGTSTVATVLSAVLNRHWKKKDEKEAKQLVTPEMITKLENKIDKSVNAQKVITKERIRYLGSCYIYSGKISLDDKTTLHEMHDAYEDLGGNGALDTVMEEVDKLKIAS